MIATDDDIQPMTATYTCFIYMTATVVCSSLEVAIIKVIPTHTKSLSLSIHLSLRDSRAHLQFDLMSA